MADSSSSTTFLAVMIAILGVTSLLIVGGVQTANAEQFDVSGSETLRIIDYQFTTNSIPEGESAKARIVIQNTGATTKTGTLEIQSDKGFVTADPNSISYSVKPGSREQYIIEINAARTDLTSRTQANLSIVMNGTAQHWESVYVLPEGSSVSEGSIVPTGNRETITKSFNAFKDNGSKRLGSYNSSIPPITYTDGQYVSSAHGRVFNFLAATSNDPNYLRVDSATENKINVGFHAGNIPDSEYYTLQFNYRFISDNMDQVRVNIVKQNGNEIDQGTTYILSRSGERQTRYLQLSEKETEWIRNTNNIYITIENQSVQTSETLGIHFMQVLSSQKVIQTTTSDITVTNTRILDINNNDITSNPSLSPGEIYRVEYTLTNNGEKVGTRNVPLYENGKLVSQKEITLNPGETGKVVFTLTNYTQGIYRYNDPSTNSEIEVSIKGDDPMAPIASIHEPSSGEDNYYSGRVITDPAVSDEKITFSAENSYDPDGTISKFTWDFEWLDNTVVTYDSTITVPTPDTKGTYEAVVTVTGEQGRTDMAVEHVYTGTIDPIAKSLGNIEADIGDSIVFDGSDSSHPDPYQCVNEYKWVDITGSSSTTLATHTGTCSSPPDPTMTHSFSESGIHTIQLVVSDDNGNTDSTTREISVGVPEPTAQITSSDSSVMVGDSVTFDASGSTSEGSIVEYRWDFGDNSTTTTTSATTSHVFNTSGTYTVTVTVVNEYGGKDTATTTVTVSEEPFNVKINARDGTSGTTDTEFTFDNSPTINRSEVEQWTWKMGDGTTYTGKDVVNHSYDSNGTYTVTLTGSTDDNGGFQDSASIQIDVGTSKPIAEIDASYPSGSEIFKTTKISFDGSSSYDPDGTSLSYSWTIEGTTYTGAKVKDYTFNSYGDKTVTLTVTDGNGQTDKATFNITIVEKPHATISANKSTITVGENVTFDASNSDPGGTSSTTITEYRWDFDGNGTTEKITTDATITTSYSTAGTKNPTVTIENSKGHTDSASTTVTVEANDKTRKFVVENPTSQSAKNYQVKFKTERPADMDKDYGSARFYQNGNELDYHLVKYNDTYATFVVELNSLSSTESTFTMKYGANSMNTASNPEDTYVVWDYHSSGMDDGTFKGSAYDVNNNYALLTEEMDSETGSLRYGTFNKQVGLKATYDWRIWSSDSNHADSVNFVTYNDGTYYEFEDPQKHGIHFSVVDHNECASVNYSGECDTGSSGNYNFDEQWHTANAQVSHKSGDNYTYYFDSNAPGAPVFDGTMTAAGVGDKFGFSGRTGGLSNYHAVRDITIRKWVGQPMEVERKGPSESREYIIENPTDQSAKNYQVKFTINRPAGMDTDYESARFYQNGNKLDYHLVNYTNTKATFVVELDSLASDKSYITMKFGQQDLASASNPEDTYVVWDYHSSGMDDGTFKGSAYDVNNNYALLTEEVDGETGSLRYGTFNKQVGLKATYDWRIWSSDSNYADSVNFVTYNDGNYYEFEDPQKHGIHFSVVDHNECASVNYSGECDTGSSGNYNFDEQWHTANAQVSHKSGDNYTYYFDSNAPGAPVFDGTMTAAGVGDKFGFSGRTGGLSNYHAVRDITIRKWVGQPTDVYMKQSVIHMTDFDSGQDGWNSDSGEERVQDSWLQTSCSTSATTNYYTRNLSGSPNSIYYEINFAAADSWDGETLKLKFRDDAGLHTVESITPSHSTTNSTTLYDCNSEWTGNTYHMTGTLDVTGELYEVKLVGSQDQADNDESIAIDYIEIRVK